MRDRSPIRKQRGMDWHLRHYKTIPKRPVRNLEAQHGLNKRIRKINFK